MMHLKILLYHAESTTHPDSEAKLCLNKNTEIGSVLDIKIICHHNVCGIEIQIPSKSADYTKVWVVISRRSSNRYVDELRHRESENLPEEVAQECVQDQDEQHSLGEWSEDRIPIRRGIWEDLAANEFSFRYKWETSRNLSVN